MSLRRNNFSQQKPGSRIPKAVCFCLFLLCAQLSFAGTTSDFRAANKLYDEGKFPEAAAAYEKITPKTANVYYNLGNAWFREGKLGLAILNYERARRLTPRDPDVLANLRFAEQRLGVEDVNTPPRAIQRFLHSVVVSHTPTEWGAFELVALWLTLLAVAGCIFLPRAHTAFLVVAIIGFLGFGASAFALGYEAITRHTAPQAVVVIDDSEARFAPLPESTVHFKLAEGTKIVIREDRDQWLLVERADGQQGWVKSDAIVPITPR
ncbi:MAG TPA: tetratricopeptide repeat protein [Verrucomicrobiae bacterium]|nr:tetratricopeptide repeat protein [Verrucomicrobiae bacterium]